MVSYLEDAPVNNQIFQEVFEQHKHNHNHINFRITQILVTEVEELNQCDRKAGVKNYFRNNLQQVIKAKKFTTQENSSYASIVGAYFNRLSQISKQRRSQKYASQQPAVSTAIDATSGQYNMIF